jgi:nanoRNase/pAp phosphatase (c-di-AMP/oligoRNAs hydrolase)
MAPEVDQALLRVSAMNARARPREGRGKFAALLSLIRHTKNIVILPHDNPDPDSLASAAALRYLVQQRRLTPPVIALSGIIGRSENRAMVSVLRIPLVPVTDVSRNFAGPVILIDTQPGRRNNALPPHVIPAAVIDHHPDWGNNGSVPFVDLRDTYGATSTILTEYLQEAEVPIAPNIATALFYGISSETQHLRREANAPDIVASQFLYPYVNKRLLGNIREQTSPG